ncbi:MAG: hemerythrin domain-containing protein [Acidobacteria bacterium]|nr:hemerythrin domain-containing protein [Acidobacteriota bacterium]
MNAIELLKEDHKKVKGYFEKVKATDEAGEQRELYRKIAEELEIHTHIEETVFYPYLIENGDEELSDLTKEGIEEHHEVKVLIREIANLSEESEKLEPKLTVLMENVEHHVQEEEGEMFPMCEEQLDSATLEDLGTQMEEEKGNFKPSARGASGK